VGTPNQVEIHRCPTYWSTGQDSCRRPDKLIVAEQKRYWLLGFRTKAAVNDVPLSLPNMKDNTLTNTGAK